MRTIISILVFSFLASSCNGQHSKAPMENKTGKGGAITEKEVKDYITKYWTKNCRDFEECKVTFDSPVRIGSSERHSFPNGITVATSYPVKVDYSHSIRHTGPGWQAVVTHHIGGVLYFYRNSFGDWQMEAEGQDTKFDD